MKAPKASSNPPKGNRGYDVKRRFYTVSSSGFSLTDTEMRHLPEGDLERFEEFGPHALADCPDYRRTSHR